VDIDYDGIYDSFHGETSGIETDLGQKGGNYLIDDDDDGKWDYTYAINGGTSIYSEV